MGSTVTGSSGVDGLAEVLRDRVAQDPAAEIVKCDAGWLTTTELDARCDRAAAGLARLGVAFGDRVAVLLPNVQEAVDTLFACARIGAVQVPLNAFLKGEFLRFQLADCGAKVLVTDEPGRRAALPLLASTEIEHLVLVGSPGDDPSGVPEAGPDRCLKWDEVLDGVGAAPEVEVRADDLCSIMYTSGTTGLPKGCMLPHAYYRISPRVFGRSGMVRPGDRAITAFPLFHAGGQVMALMGNLLHGASVCFEREFSASRFMARAREERATMLMGVGPMANAMLAQPEQPTDRDHVLRSACFAPLTREQVERFEARFGVPVIAEGYGQTECNPITWGSLDRPRPGTMGRPLDHLEVLIVDDHDVQVPARAIGEIIVRPRRPEETSMFVGYWRRPDATLEAWRNLWHHTGDYGTMDADGFITFVDRKKDAMRRRGENVSSHELEGAIAAHPGIAAVAAVAVPSELGDDDIKVSLVPTGDAALEPEDLFGFFKEHLPYFAIPRYVELRTALPTTATGRVTKHVLREEGVSEGCWDFEALGLHTTREERRG